MSRVRVAQIGNGFVGSALHKSFKINGVTTAIYDKFQKIGSINTVLDADILFLCLPTPFIKDKHFDLSAIEESLALLKKNSFKGLCVIKSTVEIGVTKMLAEKYELNMAHNPEFLTERTAFEDFHAQDYIVLGKTSDSKLFDQLILFYKKLYPSARIAVCTSDESEAMKIMRNCYYSVKISIFNEFYLLCNSIGIDYDNVRDLMLGPWVEKMHTNVPGPDGGLSYSGHCFPKDTNALLAQMVAVGSESAVLKAAIESKNRLRPDSINIIEEK